MDTKKKRSKRVRPDMHSFPARIPAPIWQKMEDEAGRMGITLAELLRRILQDHYDRQA